MRRIFAISVYFTVALLAVVVSSRLSAEIPNAPAAGVTITHYDIELTPDFESNSMHNRVLCAVRNNSKEPVEQIDFDILGWEKRVGVGVTINHVLERVGNKDTPLEFFHGKVILPELSTPMFPEWTQMPKVTRVILHRSLAPGAGVELVFDYDWRSLNASKSEDNYRLISQLPDGNRQLCLIMDYTWLPMISNLPNITIPATTTWTLSISAPESYVTAIPEGRLVRTEKHGGQEISHWEQYVPSNPQVVVGRWERVVIKQREMSVVFHVYKSTYHSEALRNFADYLSILYDTNRKLFGPLDKTSIDIIESYGNGGHGAYLGFIEEPGTADQRWLDGKCRYDYFTAHEFAHTWWGCSVASVGPGERFLHESLANFSAFYLRERTTGEDMFRTQMALLFYQGIQGKIVIHPDHDDVGAAYMKGPIVLNVLRSEIGEKTFFKALKTFSTRFAGKQAIFADFVQVFNETSGKDWSPFFEQWLFKEGCPDYRLVSFKSERQRNGWKTDISIQNIGKGIVDCPVELRMLNKAVRKNFRVLEGMTKTFTYNTQEQVSSVVIDPDFSAYQGSEGPSKLRLLYVDDCDDGEILVWRALIYAQIGEYDRAIQEMSKIMADRSRPQFNYWRGLAYMLKGDVESATSDLSNFIDLALADSLQRRYLIFSGVLTGSEEEQHIQLVEILNRLTGANIKYDPESGDEEHWNKTIASWQEWWKANKETFKPAESARTLGASEFGHPTR